MPASQDHIGPGTPMGANLIDGGCTFRVWAPRATEVYVRGTFTDWELTDAGRLGPLPGGHWGGFVPEVADGAEYKFWVVGDGSAGPKRDPFARELSVEPVFPFSNCVVRDPAAYPWHDAGFRPPSFSDLVVYQLHVGAFARCGPGKGGRFLDVIDRVPYLADLGVNAVELLPIVEFPQDNSLGYNGVDFFSPEMAYAVPPGELAGYVTRVNDLLAGRGRGPVGESYLSTHVGQLKAMIDVCHAYGLAVILDVVYNHAGSGDFGGSQTSAESLYFLDRYFPGDNNNSLYFTDQGWAGGLVFAFYNGGEYTPGVRQFLIDNAAFWLTEAHTDGLRYDEVTVIDDHGGWDFCKDLTDTVRSAKPEAPQIAEYWRTDKSWVVRPRSAGGAGFDMVWSDGLRDRVRGILAQAAGGRDAAVNLDPVRDQLYPPFGPDGAWRVVNHLENHDLEWWGPPDHHREPRVAALADPSDSRSWYARSRARVATGLLLTAPGVPMLFMGQEFLEHKFWSDDPGDNDHTLWWDGLSQDRAMGDHLRFTRELIALRSREPALRGGGVNVFHVHNGNRVVAFHRWVEGVGQDVVVVASLSESTYSGYRVGFPGGGRWREAFNSDVYDHWVNPQVAGNGGGVWAGGPPLHGLPASADLVLPANGLLVFTRD
jgi:1,4-alpha-glucan branching enzyme